MSLSKPDEPMSQLLTARQVADRLGVLPATVLRWTRNGDLPGVRLPSGQLRYCEQALNDWLVGRATQVGDTRMDVSVECQEPFELEPVRDVVRSFIDELRSGKRIGVLAPIPPHKAEKAL